MIIQILALLVFGISLCADSFAVSACSSVTLKKISWKSVALVAAVFAFVQSSLLLAGWAFGDIFVGYVDKIADIIGFGLLAYVGGSMVVEGIRGEDEPRDLNGIGNLILGAVATSIDAFAVGISFSMDNDSLSDMILKSISVLFCTALAVVLGIAGGRKAGEVMGKYAEIFGGAVLLLIGFNILFDFI